MLKSSPARSLTCLALLSAITFLAGCGVTNGSSSQSSAANSQLSRSAGVIISPSSAKVLTHTSQQFSAQVMGTTATGTRQFPVPALGPSQPSRATVTWMVNGIPGGNSSLGTIDDSGVYRAPATVPSPNTVKLSAAVGSARSTPVPITLYELGMGQLAVTPASMSFGSVAVGSNQSRAGALTAGKSSVTVYTASWNGPGFSVGGLSFPLTIPAGQSVPFTVMFAPQTAGDATGAVSFLTNAVNAPISAQVSGSGVSSSRQHKVSLSWSSVPSILGYYVYRGAQSGGPYGRVSSLQPATSYSDSSVQSGQSYYYVVTTLSKGNLESGYSNEFQAAIPAP